MKRTTKTWCLCRKNYACFENPPESKEANWKFKEKKHVSFIIFCCWQCNPSICLDANLWIFADFHLIPRRQKTCPTKSSGCQFSSKYIPPKKCAKTWLVCGLYYCQDNWVLEAGLVHGFHCHENSRDLLVVHSHEYSVVQNILKKWYLTEATVSNDHFKKERQLPI